MDNFYNKFCQSNDESKSINYPSMKSMDADSLWRELQEAISIEDYEKCSKIRDYCLKKGIIS